MRFDNGAADRKPHPQTGVLGGDIRLEDRPAQHIDHADAGIFHSDPVGAAGLCGALQPQTALTGVSVLHCIDTVADKVEQHLFDLHAIQQRTQRPARHVELQPHAVALERAFAERADRADHFNEIFLVHLRLRAAHEIADVLDDVLGAFCGIAHLAQCAGDHVEVGGFALYTPHAAAAVVDDNRQRLTQLVRERRCHLVH